MTSTTTLTLNMQLPNYSTVAYAVQGDSLTRQIVASLVDGSTPWTPPDGALAVVRYVKPDGTVGFYDTLEGGGAAVTTAGNVATITLAQQMLAVPGDVIVQLNYYTSGGEKITAFNFRLLVQPEAVTDATITSSDYFRVLTDTLAEAITAMEKLTIPVPVANGGTGATTADEARDNLGLGEASTFDILPVANGGTGAPGASAARVNLGLGSVAVENILPLTKGGTGASTAAAARDNLGLGAVATENTLPVAKGGTGAAAAAAARSNLGLGSVATESTVPISKGGTGATTQAAAREALGIGLSQLTTTYTSQTYVTSTAFGRLLFYDDGVSVLCVFNLNVDVSPGETFRTIGKVNLTRNLRDTRQVVLASQSNNSNLLVNFLQTGEIQIYSTGSATGFYRGIFPIF